MSCWKIIFILYNKTVLKVDLTIPISNTGKRDGTEIVQVFVYKVNDVDGPIKTLRSFKCVDIAAWITNNATITLPPSAFESFDKVKFGMAVTPGEYEVWYGTISANEDLKSINITIQ